MEQAHRTLQLADMYMDKFSAELESLQGISLSDAKALTLIESLLPLAENPTDLQKRNNERIREDLQLRYFKAPDLELLPKTGYRFLNAVSDFATHAKPLRETARYQENLFAKTMDGHPLIDKAHAMVLAAA